jgi:hypothetical protein
VPRLTDTSGSEAAALVIGERIQIRVQLLNADRYPAWPTERRDLVQRYADAPPASMRTLTAPAFAAAKTVAWAERHCDRAPDEEVWQSALGHQGVVRVSAVVNAPALRSTAARDSSVTAAGRPRCVWP